MAGYIFSVSPDGWKDFCNENLLYGYFTPYAPEIGAELMVPEKKISRKAKNKILSAVFGDFVTMKTGDNVYFLSKRKIYGVGTLLNIGNDCKFDNYLNASALIPDCQTDMVDVLTTYSTRARWVCFFAPEPYFFKKGADMDDVLRFRPSAFKMLRAFEGATFIKIDDDENRALKEYISLINEPAYQDIEDTVFPFSSEKHKQLSAKDLSDHILDLNKALIDKENLEYIKSEMFIEASALQAITRNTCPCLGHWDYLTHQLIASPFKPLSFIDKIDIYGCRYSEHYLDVPKLVTKYLVIELKKEKINGAALEQTMQYVDWICSEYASGDYSRIEAYVIGESTVKNIEKKISEKCQRDFIVETHPVKTQKWNDIHVIKYTIDDDIHFENM